ncbi:MAG: hypothetical protein DRO46_01435, partial [Candidatus Hecatellales archaeon]
WLFALAPSVAGLTAFYSLRFIGLTFHGEESPHVSRLERKPREASLLMLAPYLILTGVTILFGALGLTFEGFLHETFHEVFHSELHLVDGKAALEVQVALASTLFFLAGALPAYKLYISRRLSPGRILEAYPLLSRLRSFLWNRWYIDAAYNRVFIDGTLRLRPVIEKVVEHAMDVAYNLKLPFLMEASYLRVKKLQSGILTYYTFYTALFMVIMVLTFLLVWSHVPI